MNPYLAPQRIRAALRALDLRPTRGMGQNFLIDALALAAIVDAAELQPDDRVIEVGPGLGVLTWELVRRAGTVIAVELDKRLAARLHDEFPDARLRIVQGDILRLPPGELLGDRGTGGQGDRGPGGQGDLAGGGFSPDSPLPNPSPTRGEGLLPRQDAESTPSPLVGEGGRGEEGSGVSGRGNTKTIHLKAPTVPPLPSTAPPPPPYKLVANLPYAITAPVLRHFLEAGSPPELAVVLVQWEVAERIVAAGPAHTRERRYSVLAHSVQIYAEPEIVARVPAASFLPAPAVDSAVLRLRRRPRPAVAVDSIPALFRVIKAGFLQPRKQLGNALPGGMAALGTPIDRDAALAALAAAGVAPERRAETLSLDEWAVVYRHLSRGCCATPGRAASP